MSPRPPHRAVRTAGRRAFTYPELLLSTLVLALLASLLVALSGSVRRADADAVTAARLADLAASLRVYERIEGRRPQWPADPAVDTAGLVEAVVAHTHPRGGDDLPAEALVDAWGHRLRIEPGTLRPVSVGPDGDLRTRGDNLYAAAERHAGPPPGRNRPSPVTPGDGQPEP